MKAEYGVERNRGRGWYARSEDSRRNPYYVSTTAQIAEWRGAHDLWRVRQSARNRMIEVTCTDAHLETIIALRWSQ